MGLLRVRWPAVMAGVLGACLALCASGSAQLPAEGVEFGELPSGATVGSTSPVEAYLTELRIGGTTGERVSLSSLTPSVCTLSEPHYAGEDTVAEVHAVAVGVCTLSAHIEIGEVQRSFNVVVGRAPTLTWKVPAKATVGSTGAVELGSSSKEAGELSSTTPSVCKLTPVKSNILAAGVALAKVRFHAPGRCTIIAHVKALGEYKSAEAQKSFKVYPRKRRRS